MRWELQRRSGEIVSARANLTAGGFGDDRPFRIAVHHYVGAGDAWFVSAYEINLRTAELEAADLEEAKREALLKIYERLSELVESYSAVAEAIARERWELLNQGGEG